MYIKRDKLDCKDGVVSSGMAGEEHRELVGGNSGCNHRLVRISRGEWWVP